MAPLAETHQGRCEHRTELQTAVSTFIDSHPYGVTQDFDSQAHEVSVSVDRINLSEHEAALFKWGIRLGDFVHQLRSALDNVVWLMTQRNPNRIVPSRRGDPFRDVMFPVITNPGAWNEAKARCLWGVPDEAVPVLRQVQPFATGKGAPDGEPIAVLNQLSNIDKHREVPLLETDLTLWGVENIPPEFGIQKLREDRGPFVDGKEMVRLAFDPAFSDREISDQLNNYLGFRFQIALGKGLPRITPRGLLLETLELLENEAKVLLLKFEPYCR